MAKPSKRGTSADSGTPADGGGIASGAEPKLTIAESITSLADADNSAGNSEHADAQTSGQSADPAQGSGRTPELDASPGKRRRGRPPGSANKGPRLDIKDAAQKLVGSISDEGKKTVSNLYRQINNFTAMAIKEPILVIDDKEAALIGEPLAEILAEWGLNFDNASSPYARLVMAGVMVYGVRSFSIYAKRSAEAAERKPPQAEETVASEVQPPMFKFN